MRSPFPGMDPFIEACFQWGDFHDKLIAEMERTISRQLPMRYAARIRDRSYLMMIDRSDSEPRRVFFEPDVKVRTTSGAPAGTGSAVAVAETIPGTIEMIGPLEVEHREWVLEIEELNPDEKLITSIEILSPSNKEPGSDGWTTYMRKRKPLLQGLANFVEIDLLRGGRRMPMANPWPKEPYYIMMVRKERAPRATVWPASFTAALPTIRIPLAPPDPDISLPLQPLVDEVIERSRYANEIDYARPLKPPLDSETQKWLKEKLEAVKE